MVFALNSNWQSALETIPAADTSRPSGARFVPNRSMLAWHTGTKIPNPFGSVLIWILSRKPERELSQLAAFSANPAAAD